MPTIITVEPTEPFAALLRGALLRSGVTQREFAEQCGFSQGLVQALLVGRSNPQGDKIDRMIQVLRLTPTEAHDFRIAAGLAHLPPELRSVLAAQLAEFPKLRAELDELGRLVAETMNKQP